MKTVRPLITESTIANAQKGWYTFVFGAFVRKETIAKTIGHLYNVTVREVRTIRMKGKTRRVGRSMRTHKTADWKKAMVQLKKGQTIPVFEIGQEGK